MRAYRQWIVWRLEWREDDLERTGKPTKIPYVPRYGGGKASVTSPNTWGEFDEACGAPFTDQGPFDPSIPVEQTGFSGVGFVLTRNDPYGFIDLDDTHGDAEAYTRQLGIFHAFDSYSELSPSGAGLHIIVKGELPHGRRRSSVEVYTSERYMTMTGNLWPAGTFKPIAERQQLLTTLFEEMGGAAANYGYGQDKEQTQTDEEIIAIATNAVNGTKFSTLYSGDWQQLYGSQSEADFALVDILAFYTQNRQQIARLFRASALGQRDKAKRDRYISYMVEKSYDRQLPPIDVEGLKVAFDNMLAKQRSSGAEEPGGTPAPRVNPHASTPGEAAAHRDDASNTHGFPAGLVGDVAAFILEAAPRPVPKIALAGAIALIAGITGRSYNVSKTGLNQYVLLLGQTGIGKDAIAYGVSRLMAAVQSSVPAAAEFNGPGELASAPGIIKWLARTPAVLCILGEFGKKLKEMASPHASTHMIGLARALLQLYSKSGRGNKFDPTAYSDKANNTPPIPAPSLTIIGETVPESFYESLDEALISDGLLPRFMIYECYDKRQYFNEASWTAQPSIDLISRMADLTAYCLKLSALGEVHDVQMTPEAYASFKAFDVWTTDQINEEKTEVARHLWNRAHLKAMKLAAIMAVGRHYLAPLVTIDDATFATNEIVGQTNRLLAKFRVGDTGAVAGNENKQLREVRKVIATYMSEPQSRYASYGGTYEMHKQGIILEAHIQRRVASVAAFRLDKQGATASLKRTIKTLLDAGELVEIPLKQMREQHGKGARAFAPTNAAYFLSILSGDTAV
jgi:hypothetical protein